MMQTYKTSFNDKWELQVFFLAFGPKELSGIKSCPDGEVLMKFKGCFSLHVLPRLEPASDSPLFKITSFWLIRS